LAHATHTRRIPNQRTSLAPQNGQRLVVVNGASARISIVATGPLFRRTLLCDAGRDINLHAIRSHATGFEARRKDARQRALRSPAHSGIAFVRGMTSDVRAIRSGVSIARRSQ
jgi:hypothetical protein